MAKVIPLANPLQKPPSMGMVHLVGAGPGDPELITLKALRLLQQADAVVYDSLANDALLDHCRDDCQLIYAGKRKSRHSLPQQGINALLVDLARGGRQVVRLKGGDPLIFGRAGEELAALEQAGVPWTLVPGISAANGCAAAMGMSLTHRDHAQALTLITAHRRDGELDINWDLAMQPGQTVVIYMGLSCLAGIREELLRRGKPPATPFAVVSQGSSAEQQIISGTLGDILALVRQHQIQSPALLIMGEVVGTACLREVSITALTSLSTPTGF